MERKFYPFGNLSPRNFCCVANLGLYWKADRYDMSLEVLGAQSSYRGWDLYGGQYLRCSRWYPTPGFLALAYVPPIECEIDVWECARNVGKSLPGIEWKKISLSSCCLSLGLLVAHVDGTQLPCYEMPHQEVHVSRNWGNFLANSLEIRESCQQPHEWHFKWTSASQALRWLQLWPTPWL